MPDPNVIEQTAEHRTLRAWVVLQYAGFELQVIGPVRHQLATAEAHALILNADNATLNRFYRVAEITWTEHAKPAKR